MPRPGSAHSKITGPSTAAVQSSAFARQRRNRQPLRGAPQGTLRFEPSTAVRAAEPLLRIELLLGSPAVQNAPPGAETLDTLYEAAGRWLVETMVVREGKSADGGCRGMLGVLHASEQGNGAIEAFNAVDWAASIFGGPSTAKSRCKPTRCPCRKWPNKAEPGRFAQTGQIRLHGRDAGPT